jgi:RNA polymerase sigma factor (sigma-70 family)
MSPTNAEARAVPLHPVVETTDAELMQRIAEGALEPVGVLYDRYFEDVRQFLRRATSGSADAEDLAHDTFLVIQKIADRYDGRASARPYLLGVAARLLRRRRRGIARLGEILSAFASTVSSAALASPEEIASESQDMERFERALARLTHEKRVVFLLIERERLSGDEVARALEIPVNTVWTRLHHARAELRRSLSKGRAGS